MATKSRVVESSFRFGSGRYIQETGAVSRLGEEILRLHCKKPLIIGGKTALSLTAEKINASLSAAGLTALTSEYGGFCNREVAANYAETAKAEGCDLIVGAGGGNICDLSKLAASYGDLPVITVPTSSATCACFTPMSVTYTDTFRAAGTVHLKTEVNAVLADMDILCRQPERLFAAGVYDALAKRIEIMQRVKDQSEAELDVGLGCSFALARHTYDRMMAEFDAATEALRHGEINKELDDVIYLAMGATGVISGMARGSNQCALAHKIYEGCRTLFPNEMRYRLHGEMVAVGLLAQLYYNGQEAEMADFGAGLRSHTLPASLAELGVPCGAEYLQALYENLLATSAMAGTNEAEHALLWKALERIGGGVA